MTPSPKVTVLLPAYNAANYIYDALQSIINQSYDNLEILVIDDGSTDKTASEIEKIEDERIRFIQHEKNLGLISTLNEGLELITSKYIARMDADDIALPDRIEKQVEVMERDPAIGVCGSWMYVFGRDLKGDIVWGNQTEDMSIKANLYFSSPFFHPTVMIRKKVLDEHEIRYDMNYPHTEDYDMWRRLAKVTNFKNIPIPLLRYRLHEANVGVKFKDTQSNIKTKIISEMLDEAGIDHTDDELNLHTKIAATRLGESDLDAILKWSRKLIKGNKNKEMQTSVKEVLTTKYIENLDNIFKDNKRKKINYVLKAHFIKLSFKIKYAIEHIK